MQVLLCLISKSIFEHITRTGKKYWKYRWLFFVSALLPLQNTWPSGMYGLPKPRSGCPDKHWKEGFRYQDSENVENTNFKSNKSHLSGQVTPHGVRQEFCMHLDTPREHIPWPSGKYCIYRKGTTCPPGLLEGMTKAILVKGKRAGFLFVSLWNLFLSAYNLLIFHYNWCIKDLLN